MASVLITDSAKAFIFSRLVIVIVSRSTLSFVKINHHSDNYQRYYSNNMQPIHKQIYILLSISLILRIHLLTQQLLYMGIKDMEGRLHHSSMPMTVNLIKIGLLMTNQLHHTGQILVLVITSE